MFGRGSTRADIFKPNTSYPDVELLSADSGKLVNLQSLAGTKTVLFIFASW